MGSQLSRNYFKVKADKYENIEVMLRDAMGAYIPIRSGITVLALNFRQR